MKGMKPGFIARALCWSSAAVTAPGRPCYLFLALLWWSIPVWYPGSHVRVNQTSICWICDMGSQYLDVGGAKKVWDFGGKSFGCVMLRAPITQIVQVWSAVLTYIHWVARSFLPFLVRLQIGIFTWSVHWGPDNVFLCVLGTSACL